MVDWDDTVQRPIAKTAAAHINANEASITELISIIVLTSFHTYGCPNAGAPRASLAQVTFTSMALGFAFSDFGTCKYRSPSLNSADTLLSSAESGRVKLRMNVPYDRSMR